MSCYGDWKVRSSQCPVCREEVELIRKNHTIASVIETFLEENPEKKRLQTEIDEMDKKCKITEDMLLKSSPKMKRKRYNPYDDEDDDDDEEEEEEDEEDEEPVTRPYQNPYIVPTCVCCRAPGTLSLIIIIFMYFHPINSDYILFNFIMELILF